MGPRKQEFWQNVNIAKGNPYIFWIQKLDMILETKCLENGSYQKNMFLHYYFRLEKNQIIPDIIFSFWKSDSDTFWQTVTYFIRKIQWFPLSMLIFGHKYCFLGPDIWRNSITELTLVCTGQAITYPDLIYFQLSRPQWRMNMWGHFIDTLDQVHNGVTSILIKNSNLLIICTFSLMIYSV